MTANGEFQVTGAGPQRRHSGGTPALPSEDFLPARFTVLNRTRGVVLAQRLEVADTPKTRTHGLLGRDGLAEGEGLWIIPCESVHTFFMRFAIDLVYLDRKNTVKKVRSAVRPWRLSACLSAHSILELPAGVVLATGTRAGDELELLRATEEPASQTTGGVEVGHAGRKDEAMRAASQRNFDRT